MNLYNLHENPEQLHGFDTMAFKDLEFAYDLVIENPKLRPKLEPAIMKGPRYAYYYAHDILKRPWPEAEQHIMKDPRYAYYYAADVLKRPWPEAEPYIMKDPHLAYEYAIYILERRWPEAELFIMKDVSVWKWYKSVFTIKD